MIKPSAGNQRPERLGTLRPRQVVITEYDGPAPRPEEGAVPLYGLIEFIVAKVSAAVGFR